MVPTFDSSLILSWSKSAAISSHPKWTIASMPTLLACKHSQPPEISCKIHVTLSLSLRLVIFTIYQFFNQPGLVKILFFEIINLLKIQGLNLVPQSSHPKSPWSGQASTDLGFGAAAGAPKNPPKMLPLPPVATWRCPWHVAVGTGVEMRRTCVSACFSMFHHSTSPDIQMNWNMTKKTTIKNMI